MKFKIYGWHTLRKKPDFQWSFYFLPHIFLDVWYDDESKWTWTVLIFAWLIFGITFDWRKKEKS